MTTSSGCEHNWSMFILIHTKVHNRLSYRWLKKLVYMLSSWTRSQRNQRLIRSTSNITTRIHS
ncbi:hypothetical protein GW17_00035795 [Ensete ventricosum]|nr:hypothetical protein GW17_00035795 [Ensete ventricosum]RZS20915.1 hypothetical protein BHM03_00053487 [Ensete ventricosum]